MLVSFMYGDKKNFLFLALLRYFTASTGTPILQEFAGVICDMLLITH